MRKIAIAAVALCPLLIQAQVNSPAPTQSAGQKTVLESKLAAPTAPRTSTDGASTPTARTIRVSSGVTYPKLIEKADIVESSPWHWKPTEDEKVAVVRLVVDKDGKPSQLAIVRSVGAAMDNDVLAAVSHYRFEPGTLNHVPTPIEVNLSVHIQSLHLDTHAF